MNLFFRLIWTILFSARRTAVDVFGICATPFRVYPTDIDVLRHMNNGMYFSLQDLARVDFMYRTSIMPMIKSNNWYPVVTAETLQFKKSLQLFQKFEIQTKFLGWDEKSLFMEHRFVSRGQLIAQGYVQARFLKTVGGSVAPVDLLRACGITPMPMELPLPAKMWADSVQMVSDQLKSETQLSPEIQSQRN